MARRRSARGAQSCVPFKVKSDGRRLAAPACRQLDARESAHAQGPVSLRTRANASGTGTGSREPDRGWHGTRYSPACRRRSWSSMYRAASSSVSRRLMTTRPARPRAVQARPLSRRDWPRAPRAAHVAAAGTDQSHLSFTST